MADYRNAPASSSRTGPTAPSLTIEDSEPGRSVDRPPGPARGRRRCTERLARVQPTRPTVVRRLTDPSRDPDRRRTTRPPPLQLQQEGERPMTTGYATDDALVDATGRRPISTTRPSASSRSTSTPPPTSRATSRARSAGTGPASWPTASAATSPRARTSARSCPAVGHRPGHHDRPLRRQQQLVRGLGLLAAQAVRPPRRPHPQRRAQVLAGQRPAADRRRARPRRDELPAARARLRPARLPRRHPAAPRRRRALPSSTCARPAEFNGEIIAPPGMSRDRPARRSHPGRGLGPWAQTVKRGRHLQVADELRRSVRGQGRDPRQGRHRLLPHRRALDATPGSCCTSCSATSASATTTASWTECGSLIGVPIEKPRAAVSRRG